MNLLLKEIRHNPLLWLIAFVPAVCENTRTESHTLLFALAVLAIIPLATLLSHARHPNRVGHRVVRSQVQ